MKKYRARLGCWISSRYDPFSRGGRFETYEPFISFSNLYSGRGETRITENADIESVDTRARLYIYIPIGCIITLFYIRINILYHCNINAKET
jgi:hypothetical protein